MIGRSDLIASRLEPLVNIFEAVPNVATHPKARGSLAAGAPSVDRRERHPEECSQLLGTQKARALDWAAAIRERDELVHWKHPPARCRTAAAAATEHGSSCDRDLPADLLVAKLGTSG
jgi:hypothetical protein